MVDDELAAPPPQAQRASPAGERQSKHPGSETRPLLLPLPLALRPHMEWMVMRSSGITNMPSRLVGSASIECSTSMPRVTLLQAAAAH